MIGTTGADAPSRTLLTSFLGSFMRRVGDWIPIGALVSLMQELGIDEQTTRASVSRLKKRGWLAADKRHGVNGYRLTPLAIDSLTDDGDGMPRPIRQPGSLEEGWCIVQVSIPEAERARRHVFRTRMTRLGFGNLNAGWWLAPIRLLTAAREAIAELGLSDQAAVFVGQYAGESDLGDLVRRTWDLDTINRSYRAFIDEGNAVLSHSGSPDTPVEGRDAFVAYMTLIDLWRPVPQLDPGLPAELLGPDWAAREANDLIRLVVARFEQSAIDHVATLARAQRNTAVTL